MKKFVPPGVATSDKTVPQENAGDGGAMDQNELMYVIEGGPLRSSRCDSAEEFLRSNNRHKALDGLLAVAAYTFSGLIHFRGQSTVLVSLSLWTAGTTYLINLQARRLLGLGDTGERQRAISAMNTTEKNVFWLEVVASWVWLLASMQQFKIHKRLKYCGYSSWTALGCSTYFTCRHVWNTLLY
ncbi:hypothetical protein ERJ75_000141700 [Trypanosoma vivax]|uniref:Uncharacterized protein n=1 Tax=Trypanosoma vivax (strain Y486) TaxID=1055687 RepID=G0TYB9_TRYVY|nr:hypothetical protein TRVL_00195 [Trypanosoma vivax]KAH8619785.1 hypothetical protein ERJ75_000141700 [Trypanosoma vivax]CCC48966.1 conserved hypothetical protein [Trypanosoma vivax Y486]